MATPADSNEIPAHSRIGVYDVVGTLGVSTTAHILKVRDSRDFKPYALKVIKFAANADSETRNRFQREIQLAQRMKHPHIIPFVEDGVLDDCAYYVMHYVPGRTLESIVDTHHPIPSSRIIHYVGQLASALAHVHELRVVHRGLKLKNIIVNKDDHAFLGNLGVALSQDPRLTQPGFVVGAPPYMAPEQFQDGKVTPATDVYSLGVCMYHMVTGKLPFDSRSPVEIMQMHLAEKPMPLAERRSGVPESWHELIAENLMAKEPKSRPQSMAEVQTHLDIVAADVF